MRRNCPSVSDTVLGINRLPPAGLVHGPHRNFWAGNRKLVGVGEGIGREMVGRGGFVALAIMTLLH